VAGNDFIWRFTPSRTDLHVLEEIFVQRHEILADIIERVRESGFTGNKHQVLLVGPRGIGKTHLITLLQHRITQDRELAERVRIAWLLEDETITSFVQLLKRIYESLAEEYPTEFPRNWLEDVLDRIPGQIRKGFESILVERFRDKTLLLIVENLDLLFDGLGDEGEKQLRAFLQTHPFTSIVATSQRLFKGARARERPFFGFFATEHLRPLAVADAVELLCRIARHREQADLVAFLATPEGRSRVRAIHHLAGGNHRIYIILSGFITRDSLDELAGPFEKMVDELTPYYQERMRWLTPQQRQIVEHLCAREETCTPKGIARHLLTTENSVSSQLKKLLELGYVLRSPRGRESLYELAEPLMRLASEVKEKRHKPFRLLVNFLRIWYRPDVLPQLLAEAGTPSLRVHLQAAISESRSKPDPRLKVLEREAAKAWQGNHTKELAQILEELAQTVGSAEVWTQSALEHHKLRDYEAAIGCTNYALAIEPSDAVAWTLKGACLVSLDRHLDALVAFEKALETDQANALPWMLKGIVLHTLARHMDAIECFDKAINVRSSEALVWLYKGRCRDELEQVEAALECYSQAVSLDPLLVEAWNRKAVSLTILGKHEAAVECIDKVLEIDGEGGRMTIKGINLAILGQDADAVECLEKGLTADPTARFGLPFLGNSLNNLGRYADALERVDDYLTTNAAGAQDWKIKAAILDNLGRCEAAIECVDRALEIAPHDKTTWILKGDTLRELNQDAAAINCYDEALEIDPKDRFVWYKKSDALEDLGQYDRAIECADMALEIDPNYADAWHIKGYILGELNRYAEAIECYDKALEIDPQQEYAWINKGHTLTSLGRHESAIDCFGKGLEIVPDDTSVLINKGSSLSLLGRYDDAGECYNRVLVASPTDPLYAFHRSTAMFGLRRWEPGFAALSEAIRERPLETRDNLTDIVALILRLSERKERLCLHATRLFTIFSDAGMLGHVGDALLRSLRRMDTSGIDVSMLDAWRDAWLKLGSGHAELEIPLRIFRVGVKYVIQGNDKVMLDLVASERKILRQAFGLDVTDDGERGERGLR
jgi:tetratricopeptide (TPR) repeat protein/DNA-binding transcriptional ArsR family regulator